jgi:hypothetical protein
LKRVFECSPTAAREGGILAPEHAFNLSGCRFVGKAIYMALNI